MKYVPGQRLSVDTVAGLDHLEREREDLAQERSRLTALFSKGAEKGQSEGYQDGLKRTLVAGAEQVEAVKAQLDQDLGRLQDVLTDLVCETLDEILGSADRAALVRDLIGTKLHLISDAGRVRFEVAADIEAQVRAELDQLEKHDWEVRVNEGFKSGRIMIATHAGYMDIGVKDQSSVARKIVGKRIALDILQNTDAEE